ncbi:hypothetical protein OWM07_07515 [Deferribacter thermophilus]|uniref:hypothetical protein n=1 Tax=Deferribacter thermophilus TaxID=53573 RepID=UPI003C22D013
MSVVAISGGKMYSYSDEKAIQSKIINVLFVVLFIGFVSTNYIILICLMILLIILISLGKK